MHQQIPPYKVTKAPTSPQKRVRLLILVQFDGGPLNGSNRKVEADEHRLPPTNYVGNDPLAKGRYLLRPGTLNYTWVTR